MRASSKKNPQRYKRNGLPFKPLHLWTESHLKNISGRLRRDIFPWIGARPVGEISAPELLSALRRIEARGHLENAHRT